MSKSSKEDPRTGPDPGAMADLKVLLAPMNLANMPVQIVRALRARGITAEHVQYSLGQGHRFNYELDREVNIRDYGGQIAAHSAILREYIERDFDLFHFWNKSLFYNTSYTHLNGFDLPLLKARGKRILFRFSGFDLRLPSWDLEANPYSPFRYGYEHKFDEDLQRSYISFLGEYVDQFLVQDPELQQFFPRAKIIPRAITLREWDYVGIDKTDRPLVVHAPSDAAYKGTKFVLAAIDSLREEGLSFDFKLIENMSHQEAIANYKKADIIVDQLLIGATGVLTLEAWALGKPVVLYLREDLFQPFYRTSDLPVANANPDTVTDVLRRLIKDYDWRAHLSRRGRQTAESFHSIDDVVDQFITTYQTVHAAEPVRPSGTSDVDYLEFYAKAYDNLPTLSVQQAKRLTAPQKLDLLGRILPPAVFVILRFGYRLRFFLTALRPWLRTKRVRLRTKRVRVRNWLRSMRVRVRNKLRSFLLRGRNWLRSGGSKLWARLGRLRSRA